MKRKLMVKTLKTKHKRKKTLKRQKIPMKESHRKNNLRLKQKI